MNELDILVVEDEDICATLCDFFSMKNHSAKCAKTGGEALKLIENEKPKIILLDIQLADEISGIDVLNECGKMSFSSKIFIMSAYVEKYEDTLRGYDIHGFIRKPISIKNVYELIKNALSDS